MDEEILLEDGNAILEEQGVVFRGGGGRWYKYIPDLRPEECEPCVPDTVMDDDELMQILLAA